MRISMSHVFVAAALASGISVFANDSARQADVYERLGTVGEWPTGFKAIKDVEFKMSKGPSTLLKRDQKCRLKAGADLGFASLQKTTQVARYQVLKNHTLELVNNDGGTFNTRINLSAGEIVEDLSYIAEGYCDVRVRGKIYEESCFGNRGDAQIYKELAPLVQQDWFHLSCSNNSGWIQSEDLHELANKGYLKHKRIDF